MGLTGFERRLERLVEGVFARAFRSQLRPVELGRRAIRELDLRATLGVRGEPVAPNDVSIDLSPDDFDRMAELGQALITDLTEAIEEHAEAQRYTLKGPASVALRSDPSLRPGQIEVHATIKPGPRPHAPSAWLQLQDGGRVAVREGEPVVVGRLPECDIVLNDPNVSRRHAEIRLDSGVLHVVDLGSLNGTKVNGRGVPQSATGRELVDGDEIQIGAATFSLVVGSGELRR